MSSDPPRRLPRPKPLIAALLFVAFFGGSCTVQKVLGPAETPSDQEIGRLLESYVPDAEARPKLVAATQTMLVEQARVRERFQSFATLFGLALLTLYSFTFLRSLRAWSFAADAARPLSKVAMLVLPARVAVAAVDLATAKALEPATRAMATVFAQAQPAAVPADQAEAVSRALTAAAPWAMASIDLGSAVAVCVLFHFAWRYFQRPDVVALYERPMGTTPGA